MINIIIAQIMGLLCFVANIFSTQQDTKNKTMIYNRLANCFSGIQYILLGAYNGAISILVAITRDTVFIRYKKKIPLYILIIYIIVAITVNIPCYNGIISLLPIFNIIVYGIAVYQNNVEYLKLAIIFVGISGAIYDAASLAIVGMFSNTFLAISGIIGYIRYRNLQSKKNMI